jgi:hypothetical protein
VVPDAKIGDPDNANKPERLALYDFEGKISYIDLPTRKTRNLHRWNEKEILLTAVENGTRKAYVFNVSTLELTPAFPFIEQDFDQMGYVKDKKILTLVHNNNLNVYRGTEKLVSISNVNRAIPDNEGRYVAIEVDGTLINPEDIPLPNHLSEAQKARERERLKQKHKSLPSWAKNDKPPPEIHMIDLEKMERFRFMNFYGKNFEWYLQDSLWRYASVVIHGITQKKINPNIALIPIEEDLLGLDVGMIPHYVQRLGKIQ